MIAKLCCWGRTRESAISNMARALREYKILGIKTTIPFHQRVLKNAAFLEGKYDTTFIDTRFDKGRFGNAGRILIRRWPSYCRSRHYEQEEGGRLACNDPSDGSGRKSLWKYYGKVANDSLIIKLKTKEMAYGYNTGYILCQTSGYAG